MLFHHERLQALECTVCQELVELRRPNAHAPEVLALLKEQFAHDHERCKEFADDPARARAERKYRAGMRDLLAAAPALGLIGRPSSMAHRRAR